MRDSGANIGGGQLANHNMHVSVEPADGGRFVATITIDWDVTPPDRSIIPATPKDTREEAIEDARKLVEMVKKEFNVTAVHWLPTGVN